MLLLSHKSWIYIVGTQRAASAPHLHTHHLTLKWQKMPVAIAEFAAKFANVAPTLTTLTTFQTNAQ
jgi:hypothetical protein